jgi:vacuolar protein sorting-associated protein 52
MPTAFPTEETAYPTEERHCSVYDGLDSEEFGIDLGTLNITSEDIDFDEIDDDLERFQEDETVQQALQRGVDLRKYAEELSAQLKEAETETVSQYMENKEDVKTLHEQMEDCDAVLARMQEMLLGFQTDLGGISEEIKHLQDESLSMNIRLKNRRAAEELIHKFLDQTAVNPEMAAIISSAPVNEEFVQAVVDLSKKLHYLQQKAPSRDGTSLDLIPSETHVGQTLLPELERLKTRCMTKIKDYFVMKFKELRKPKTNIQMLQQNSLIKFAPLLKFLQEENEAAAEEIRYANAPHLCACLCVCWWF